MRMTDIRKRHGSGQLQMSNKNPFDERSRRSDE